MIASRVLADLVAIIVRLGLSGPDPARGAVGVPALMILNILAGKPLPDKPMEFDTGEGQKIRVVVVTKALENPWSIAFLPDGSLLVTERAGRLRLVKNGKLDPQPVPGGPAGYVAGESGLPGAVLRATRHRDGSWCSRYWRRVI